MQHKLILQIETATTACSVSLAQDGQTIALKEESERNIHATHLTLFIDEVMRIAGKNYQDLDAIAVSMGPGSYTGLRIGISTAKGLCYALDKPLIAINTLIAMSAGLLSKHSFSESTLLCPMIDARRMEVYSTLTDTNLNIIESTQAKILDEHTFDKYLTQYDLVFFGDGAEKCKLLYQTKPKVTFLDFQNSSAHLSELSFQKLIAGQTEDVAYFEPFYLKDFMVTQAKKA
ncbi:MAG: tRNA (adenosine(37)-N6)-threonylcarbamoyltransferase complex dimerization subunit type 1 TsaB [Daejeonella sp.]